jgi:hypothetical protein
MTLGGNVEALELAREAATEVTTPIATEPVDWSTDGCKTVLV